MKSSRLNTVLGHAALILLGIGFLAPFAFMLSTSLKLPDRVFTPTIEWIPRPVVWNNYPEALTRFPFWRYVGNTVLLCVLTVIGTVISAALPAYGFARLR